MAWDYAELSKEAKKVGGPEALVDSLMKAGVDEGKAEMYPIIAVAGCVGIGIGTIVTKARAYFKKRKEKQQLEIESAKAELIEGINRYDAEHDDESEDTEE